MKLLDERILIALLLSCPFLLLNGHDKESAIFYE